MSSERWRLSHEQAWVVAVLVHPGHEGSDDVAALGVALPVAGTESSSSRKTTHGRWLAAAWKASSRGRAAATPRTADRSPPVSLIKLAPNSPASARTKKDLPTPGGPWKEQAVPGHAGTGAPRPAMALRSPTVESHLALRPSRLPTDANAAAGAATSGRRRRRPQVAPHLPHVEADAHLPTLEEPSWPCPRRRRLSTTRAAPAPITMPMTTPRMRSVMADGLGGVTFLANSTAAARCILVVVERGYVVAALEGHPFDRA